MGDASEERPRRQRPPRSPSPIHARVTDARRLLRLFRELVQVPLFRSMRVGVDRAQSARTLLNQLDQLQFDPQINDAQLEERLRALFATISAWHRRRLIDTFRRALGRDITGYLGQAAVAGVLEEAIQANVALISTIPEHAHAGLARRLHRFLLVSPFDQAEVRKLLTEQYSVTGSRLLLIARDQSNKLVGQLTEVRQQEAGIRSYIWLTSRDERVRPTHASKEGMRFFWASPPADTGHPGSDIQCFPGEAAINPAGVHAAVSYRYVGKLIEIYLAGGVKISATPNHPILTKTGWKGARDIKEGDELVKHRGAQSFATRTGYPEFHHGYTLAEKLHRLLGGARDRHRAHARHIDLHGRPQRRDEEIQIVHAPRILRDSFEAMEREMLADLVFESTNTRKVFLGRDSVVDPRLVAPLNVTGGSVSPRRQGLSLLVGEAGHSKRVGLAGRTAMQPQVVHAGIDDRAVETQRASDAQNGYTFSVEAKHLAMKLYAPLTCKLVARYNRDAEVVQARVHHLAADPERFRDLLAVLAGIGESLDGSVVPPAPFEMVRAVGRRTIDYDGAVFNFETHTGLIIANGIVTHNCRCVPAAYVPGVTQHRTP